MARVTHVKHARARFEMVEKRDDFGAPIQVPVLRKDGTPKTTRSGRPITRTLSVQDRSKPLPNYKCGKCGVEITPGMPYKWIEPKMRGLMVRCADCPSWNVWEYSSSLSSRVAEIQSNASDALAADFEDQSELQDILNDIASEIRGLADEKQEAADNMESGFGHETSQSAELVEQADQLNSWADEVEGVDIPEVPEPETECASDWHDEDEEEREGDICPECGGDSPQMVAADGGGDEQLDEWREEARAAAQDAIDNCPL